jgi:hypothetical protein
MKKESINLVYIINNVNIKGPRIIEKLIEYGAINTKNFSGLDEGLYFIDVDNTICFFKRYNWILPILKLAGYKNITSELKNNLIK